ncbi:hypothetical protein BZL30_6475 [Mycobacterium kansasii]|uniref:THAP4-like heme-binding domain-containing protein n=1 Tax=Mycobacterium kansasii TaxID=1768 RepID=A0A1V3WV55_MYCKA|nr:hypothetical protein BZL30_6475 [Mycobacterium kansasii]
MTSDDGHHGPGAGSGDRAVAGMFQAAERAKLTATRNIPVFDDLPLPADTANLRQGASLHDALLALLPLVGVWRGEGEGRGHDGDYRFGQQIVVSHDGGDYLNWEARSWRLTDTGEYLEPGLRETGFWRFVSDPDDPSESQAIELLLAHSAGYVELFYGRPRNQSSWELVTDALAGAAPACWSAGQAALRHRRGRRPRLCRGAGGRRRRVGAASVGALVQIRRLRVAPGPEPPEANRPICCLRPLVLRVLFDVRAADTRTKGAGGWRAAGHPRRWLAGWCRSSGCC